MDPRRDRAFGAIVMQRVTEPANRGWVAPPDRGINNLPVGTSTLKLT